MKKFTIVMSVLISMFMLGGCKEGTELKGFYQTEKDVNGYFVQMSVDEENEIFTLYIDNREVNKGSYKKNHDNLYNMKGENQQFDIELKEDNSFDIYIKGISNDQPIKMKNQSDVPSDFSKTWGDEAEYKKLLVNAFQASSLENDQGYQNALVYIQNSTIESWKKIPVGIVKSHKVDKVSNINILFEEGKEALLDSMDEIYVIGDTSSSNHVNIVCDYDSKAVIGYLVIE